ncbi:hypothetical protein BRADI_4g16200v3 [Brachypodium distachyon]|nr:hypothetical protein BRADI_4g16200v3 [Brachypodium distachyon]
MHIVNPITSEQVDLPSVITIEQVKPVYDDSGALRKYRYSRHTAKEVYSPPMIVELDELREMLHYKAFVFPNTTTGQYIVVLFHNPHRQLSFTRVGDDSWTWLPPRLHYEDCLYKDGLLYAVNYDGEIDVYDLSGPTVTMQIVLGMTDAITYSCMYIVQAPWGDLLQVWKSYKDYELHPEPGAFVFWNTGKFEIYEIDIERGERKKVKCLHDHALFLGHNQSLCISSVEYPALKRNHAYFTDDSYFWTRGFENNSRDIAILNLDNNIREELVSPQLWSDFPAPMWITLDVRAMDSALKK